MSMSAGIKEGEFRPPKRSSRLFRQIPGLQIHKIQGATIYRRYESLAVNVLSPQRIPQYIEAPLNIEAKQFSCYASYGPSSSNPLLLEDEYRI